MKRTKKKAIEITIELWGFLAETGGHKWKWKGWEKYGEMRGGCPLCEYSGRKAKLAEGTDCRKCPLKLQLGKRCFNLGYRDWDDSETVEDRKKYAKLFLEELRRL